MKEYKTRQLAASKRTNYRNQLAAQWVKTMRPDIWEQVQKEAEKMFPLVVARTSLPDSLRNLK